MAKRVVYVGLGSNLGNRKRNLEAAVNTLAATQGFRVQKMSRVYETEPIGPKKQPAFLNALAKGVTSLSPAAILKRLKTIEKEIGRKKSVRWGPRIIDLDLISYGQTVMKTPSLTLPHPYYYQRRFVLVPLCELAPGGRHPVTHQRNKTLLDRLTLQGQRVTIYSTWKKLPSYRSKKRKRAKSQSRP